MADIKASEIKDLRSRTGAGMLEVKKALEEAGGDAEKAEEILRVKGLKSLAKREGRTASAGLVISDVQNSEGQGKGILLEINSETDFVAKNEKFMTFAEDVLAAAVVSEAKTVEDVVDAPLGNATVKDRLDQMAAVIGEKIEISHYATIEGEHVASYMHRTASDLPPQVGVLVATDAKGSDIAHDIAVHIAALSPTYLDRDSVPSEVVDAERRIAQETTRAEGKPEKMVDKIAESRLGAFFKQVCLLEQPYARDPKQTVGQILTQHGGNVTGFVRIRVGNE